MSILINKNTKVLVQGITGRDGGFHTKLMMEYGTKVAGGVTPGKGGQEVHGLPVFSSVKEAVDKTGADASVIYVPAKFCKQAMIEAASSGIKLVITITEGIPANDVLEAFEVLQKNNVKLIGPNCPGLITPGEAKIGIMPGSIHKPGRIGLISRSGTLTYEIVNVLTDANLGQSTVVGVGGDPVIGSRFIDLLPLYEADPDTDAVVLIGEIGGSDEIEAAEYFKNKMKKKIVAFLAGRTAPAGRRMGHAGAIVGGKMDTAAAKTEYLEKCGIPVAKTFEEIPGLLKK